MTAAGPAVDALTARFVAALGRRGAMAELMAVASLGGAPQLVDTAPDLPVLAHLEDALARVGEEVDEQLRDALAVVTKRAAWTRTASYADDEALFAGYAHAPLRTDDDVVLGLVVLGPDVHYRAHHHPAEEYYLPLGTIGWDHGEEWVDEPAGELVHHAPWQPHAMRTGERPVLLAYLWFDEVDTPSAFVDP
ncbi:dimethylsulfonioproprionate lyase family protein [Actinomycetospora termitidis]|uniref:Dimethylsulfonioproprionate lyase family protein n=1 Tax=Actinomycetospora termitidis TaxID=3053470 RepID=A0ABT7M5E8_9PSEU|nr:dimethylsulfonioproprionate lyase family protein [Actinomycetospora sp. Odt1-22]MDL5155905.1 dimethylsulfonioproprionate lyase family protein [Actinomycetospora sp. Odt1-22]